MPRMETSKVEFSRLVKQITNKQINPKSWLER